MPNEKKVDLSGGLKHTSSTLEIQEDGSLLADYYDFSDKTESFLGNDFAIQTTVAAELKPKLLELLPSCEAEPADEDGKLPRRMRQRFGRYYELQDWLESNDIPCKQQRDPSA